MDNPGKGDPGTPFMDVYKEKIKSDGSPDKFKFVIVVREYLKNKEMIGYPWYPTVSTMNLKNLLGYDSKNRSRVHQLDFIGDFPQANVKHRVSVKLDIRYG